MRRLENSRLGLWTWALVTVVTIGSAIGALVAFTLKPVGSDRFAFHAMFTSDAQIHPGSPVRIAGVDVGTVSSVAPAAPGSGAVDVGLELGANAPPIYTDATLEIRSRLVFEGNFAVALQPGSPGAGELAADATLPAAQTSGPIQFDRILSDLPTDTRAGLQVVIQGLGRGLGEPRHGSTAGQALNRSFADWPAALRGNALVSQALLGHHPHDLSRLVAGSRRIFTAMAGQRRDLRDLVTGLDRTLAAFASRRHALGRTLRLLPGTLAQTKAATAAIDDSLPPTRAFARALTPALTRLPKLIDTGNPWVRQATALFGDDELGRLAPLLADVARDGAGLTATARPLVDRIDRIDRCWLDVLLPASDIVIEDPPLPSGGNVRDEFLQSFVGVASAAQNFDANGPYVRAQTAGGNFPVETSPLPSQGPLRGNAAAEPLGTRPAKVTAPPPYRPQATCADADVPDLNSARTGATP